MKAADAKRCNRLLAEFWARDADDGLPPEAHADDGNWVEDTDRQVSVLVKWLRGVQVALKNPLTARSVKVLRSYPKLSKRRYNQTVEDLLEDVADLGRAIKEGKRR